MPISYPASFVLKKPGTKSYVARVEGSKYRVLSLETGADLPDSYDGAGSLLNAVDAAAGNVAGNAPNPVNVLLTKGDYLFDVPWTGLLGRTQPFQIAPEDGAGVFTSLKLTDGCRRMLAVGSGADADHLNYYDNIWLWNPTLDTNAAAWATPDTSKPFSVTNGSDTVTCTGHGLSVGSGAKIIALTGIPQLQVGTTYYVVTKVSANAIKIATAPGGAAITFTSTGTGVLGGWNVWSFLGPYNNGARASYIGWRHWRMPGRVRLRNGTAPVDQSAPTGPIGFWIDFSNREVNPQEGSAIHYHAYDIWIGDVYGADEAQPARGENCIRMTCALDNNTVAGQYGTKSVAEHIRIGDGEYIQDAPGSELGGSTNLGGNGIFLGGMDGHTGEDVVIGNWWIRGTADVAFELDNASRLKCGSAVLQDCNNFLISCRAEPIYAPNEREWIIDAISAINTKRTASQRILTLTADNDAGAHAYPYCGVVRVGKISFARRNPGGGGNDGFASSNNFPIEANAGWNGPVYVDNFAYSSESWSTTSAKTQPGLIRLSGGEVGKPMLFSVGRVKVREKGTTGSANFQRPVFLLDSAAQVRLECSGVELDEEYAGSGVGATRYRIVSVGEDGSAVKLSGFVNGVVFKKLTGVTSPQGVVFGAAAVIDGRFDIDWKTWLTAQAAGFIPVVGTPPAGFQGRRRITSADSPYAVPLELDYLEVDSTGGPVTVQLGSAVALAGKELTVKVVAYTNNVTLTAAAGSVEITKLTGLNQLARHRANGTNWIALGNDVYSSLLGAKFVGQDPRNGGGTGTLGANTCRGYRVVVPRTGTLRDLAVFVATASGNIEVGVLSTDATNRSRLWTTGSIACPTASVWTIVGDPALAVNAGDHLDFYCGADNALAAFARTGTLGATPASALPAGYLSGAAADPKLAWGYTGFPMAAAPAETALTANNAPILVIGRIA